MSDYERCDCCEEEYNCDCNKGHEYECKCSCRFEQKPKALKPNRTCLKCGIPGSVTIPLATLAGTSFTVATVNVDTKRMNHPCIKFEFASNIVTTAAVITINFQIFKQCKNQLVPIPIGSIWTFSRLVAITDSNTFSFFVCDCDTTCDDCCSYSVVATIAGIATVGVTSINNASLAAIVVDDAQCNC
jgi:hypothetical protein